MSEINTDNMEWYMIRCAVGKEEKAIKNLEFELEHNGVDKYVGEIICPREKQYFMRNEKKVSRDKIMFPGYFLMQMDLMGEIPRIIKSTNLVSQIMGDAEGPKPLKEHEVTRIFGNVEKSNETIQFLEGEEVSIIDGPFKSFKGTIKSVDKDKERVSVNVGVFGTITPVELNYFQIDKVK